MQKSAEGQSVAAGSQPRPVERETRVDPAHPPADGRQPPLEVASTAAASSGPTVENPVETAMPVALVLDDVPQELAALAVVQQVRLQAQQLATHLRHERSEIDRREAQVTAQLAQQDSSDRQARLWLREAQQELAQREAQVARRERVLQWRLSQLGSDQPLSPEDLDDVSDFELVPRPDEMHERSAESASTATSVALAAAVRELILRFLRGDQLASCTPRGSGDRKTGAEEKLPEAEKLMADLAPADRELMTTWLAALERERLREEALEESESLLARGQDELEAAQKKLAEDRRSLLDQIESGRRELDERAAAEQADRQQRAEQMAEHAKRLETRAAGLDALREQLLADESSVLQHRLAVEELWAQLAGPHEKVPATAVAVTRAKLAECRERQRHEAAVRQEQLSNLAQQIAQRQSQILHQRSELIAWTKANQSQIEQQIASVARRETALRQAQAELEEARRLWQRDRRELDEQARALFKKLRQQLAGQRSPLPGPDGP